MFLLYCILLFYLLTNYNIYMYIYVYTYVYIIDIYI